MKKLPEELRMSIFLIVLTTICTVSLTAGNLMYMRVLAEQEREMRMDILKGFGVSFTKDTFDSIFKEFVEVRKESTGTYYFYEGSPRLVSVITEGSGLWSIIEIFFSINLDTFRMQELKVISHGETPGLGGRIEEPWFAEQFEDLDVSKGVSLVAKTTGAPGEVDAISGASRTSEGVMTILNKAITTLQSSMNPK